ncbi:mRNA 3'-end-processing protein RNA14 [Colletotrichum navitas]|uniref:mRNA 3'-end-processing protein RNA14 n=1 Tax=Colletotrichum navitas TaxID=681940 RepID=A0AAD8PWA8_9PEZI|nr:mRNA 3'-end-processing protein RNA14 [Colletotrichum navitas]KAK1585164.1 mRNA 3'-end-processing protein RNA14 [Colletotrichum navitas]
MDPELPQSGEHFEGASWGEEGYEEANDIQHSDQQSQDPSFPLAQAANGDSEDAGEYDPESVTITSVPETPESKPPTDSTPAPAPTTSTSAKPKSGKPKTQGGFLVGDSDDEEDVSTPASTTAVAPDAAQPPVTRNHPPLTVSTPVQTQVSATPEQPNNGTAARAPSAASSAAHAPAPPTVQPLPSRDPNDTFGILEDRVKEDPRGDMEAWLALIAEHRRYDQLDELRAVYERFVQVFPQAADIWADWAQLELSSNRFQDAEALFNRSLVNVPNVKLWTVYLNYIRRRYDLTNDPNGEARRILSMSYDFVIGSVGIDRDSGQLWKDYIQFIKSGPGQVGGSGWQDQQKMDQLRKAYHRAITVPMSALTDLWKDYDQFEMSLNKTTGRQFIQKRSPAYMTAKAANSQLDRLIPRLQRTSLPRLPPAPGFDGDQEFLEQVEIWKKWIQWEKDDPLVLLDEEPEAYKARILYCYRQALMALRFWPEMWVDAAEWCFANNITKDGKELGLSFLTDGIEANPESVLLALKHGDRVESTYPAGDDEASKAARAKAIREPYSRVLDTLYAMSKKIKEREEREVRKIEEAAARDPNVKDSIENNDEEPDSENNRPADLGREERIKAVKHGFSVQADMLKRTISFVWIALCRAARRTQGKGNTNSGLRQVFIEARGRGQLTSDVYIAVAKMEALIYNDPAGGKIFDRGAKLFPEDASFMLEYLKFLHSKGDTTNARVVFETCVNRLTQKDDKKDQAKQLYSYFHKYESQFGELSSISELEKRMSELWPADPKLTHFANRFSVETFDPISYRLIISPAVQLRPKMLIPAIEQPNSVRQTPMPPLPVRQTASPGPQYMGNTNSPKRPFAGDEYEELNRPRKLARGESPLKGAAGRRLDQQRRNQGAPLSRDITFLLGILPPAHAYAHSPGAFRLSAPNLVGLLRETPVPDYSAWKAQQELGARQNNGMQPPSHGQQASGDYAGYGHGGRNSPQRAFSSLDGRGRRLAPSGYRNSPLRPGSSGGNPEAAAYRQDATQQGYYPPAAPYDGNTSWALQPAGYCEAPAQQYEKYQY